MSLIQHVSSYDGVDRDGPATEESLSVVRRQISYDAFSRSAEEESLHRLAPYKVSVAKRIGKLPRPAHSRYGLLLLTNTSPGNRHNPGLLAGFGDCIWFCSTQTCASV
jgi:hypothetical protein